jgi:hypothetical protein
MTLVTFRCPRCASEVEAVHTAHVWHAGCPKRKQRERAPLYVRVEEEA